jgi:hypothetical protein
VRPDIERDAPTGDAPTAPTRDRPTASHPGDAPTAFAFASAADFAAVEEESAETLLGDENGAALDAGSLLIMFGDGGAGKTTLTVDGAVHLTTGVDWLGLPVPRRLRVLMVENDGPRGPFRRKVRAKLASWDGPKPGDHLLMLEEPWGEVSLARADHRQALAAFMREHEVDLLVAGPIVTLGMVGGGTPDEVAAFEGHLRALRGLLERPLAVWLIHHENVRGQISGAWTRVPDTLLHVTQAGNGHTRLLWKKARWSAALHGTTMPLRWADGESFELDEHEPVSEEDIAAAILDAARANPGGSWNAVGGGVTGKGQTKAAVRDRLIAERELVNRGKGSTFALWAAVDPALPPDEPEPLL